MDKEQVLRVLDAEIQGVQASNNRSGITTWVLITTIVGIFWLLLSLIQQNELNVRLIAWMLLIGILLSDATTLLASFVVPKNDNQSSAMFRSPFDYAYRIGSLYIVFWSLIPIGILNFFHLGVGPYLGVFVNVYYGFLAISGILYFLLDVILNAFDLSLPTPNKKTQSHFHAEIVLMAIDFLLFALLYLYMKDVNYSVVDVVNLKAALICLGLLYLFTKLVAAIKSPEIFLPLLTSIRRDVNFGRLDPETAMQQAEIIIYGRKLDHLMQKRIYKIMLLSEEINAIMAKINTTLDEILVAEVHDAIEVRKKLVEVASELHKHEGLLDEMTTATDNLLRALRVVGMLHPEAIQAGLEPLTRDKITNAITTLKANFDALKNQRWPQVETIAINLGIN